MSNAEDDPASVADFPMLPTDDDTEVLQGRLWDVDGRQDLGRIMQVGNEDIPWIKYRGGTQVCLIGADRVTHVGLYVPLKTPLPPEAAWATCIGTTLIVNGSRYMTSTSGVRAESMTGGTGRRAHKWQRYIVAVDAV